MSGVQIESNQIKSNQIKLNWKFVFTQSLKKYLVAVDEE